MSSWRELVHHKSLGQTRAYDNYYHWAKPSEDDMKCGCDTVTVREYDPNGEDGAHFVCAESNNFSTEVMLINYKIYAHKAAFRLLVRLSVTLFPHRRGVLEIK